MESNVFVLGLYKVKQDMAAVFAHTLSIAEPLVTVLMHALDNVGDLVDSAICTGVLG